VWAYFDSSALVKRYIEEAGRREVLQLMRRYEVVTSTILPIELRSAVRRRAAEGTLDAARLPEILKRISMDRAYWTLVEVGSAVLTGAETLVATHPLRALDAIHVASAQMFAARIKAQDSIFVSADNRQTDVATVLGMNVRLIG
jgi:predicted nucleic acid-binding protein